MLGRGECKGSFPSLEPTESLAFDVQYQWDWVSKLAECKQNILLSMKKRDLMSRLNLPSPKHTHLVFSHPFLNRQFFKAAEPKCDNFHQILLVWQICLKTKPELYIYKNPAPKPAYSGAVTQGCFTTSERRSGRQRHIIDLVCQMLLQLTAATQDFPKMFLAAVCAGIRL